MPTPAEQVQAFATATKAALEEADREGSARLLDLPLGPERLRLTEDLARINRQLAALAAQEIADIADSPAVQAAIAGLGEVVADLQAKAGHLKTATTFLTDLTGVAGKADKALSLFNELTAKKTGGA